MNGCDDRRIQDSLLDELTPTERAAHEAHLRGCARCAEESVRYARMFEALAALPAPEPRPGIADLVLARLAAARGRNLLEKCLSLVSERPLLASAAGGASGILLLLFGWAATGFIIQTAGRTLASLVVAIAGATRDLLIQAIAGLGVAETLLRGSLRAAPLVRSLGGTLVDAAARELPLYLALLLGTALLVGRLVGRFRREELGHANQ